MVICNNINDNPDEGVEPFWWDFGIDKKGWEMLN